MSLKSEGPFPEASSRHPPCFTSQQLVKCSFSKNEIVFTGLDELGFTSSTGSGVDTQARCRLYQPGRRSDCFQGGSDSNFIIMLPGKDSENTDHLYCSSPSSCTKIHVFSFKVITIRERFINLGPLFPLACSGTWATHRHYF